MPPGVTPPYTHLLLFLVVIYVSVLGFVFSISGIHDLKVDGEIYIGQIVDMVAQNETSQLRLAKPFYGVVGSWLAAITDPYTAMLVINLTFFAGLILLSFVFLQQLSFDYLYALIGTVWIATAYPLLKYGLALGTDISGWFFALTCIVLTLHAVKTNQLRFIIYTSIVGFLGVLAKETVVIGLLFAGLYVISQYSKWDYKKIVLWLAGLCGPFFMMYFLWSGYLYFIGMPGFLEWYTLNKTGYADNYYKLTYFFGVLGSTFNILLVFALGGVMALVRRKNIFTRDTKIIYAILLIASLPILLWPVFISRVLFIQFIIVVPLALLGSSLFYKKCAPTKKLSTPFFYLLALLPPLISVTLFLLSGAGSLFTLCCGGGN